MWGSDYPHHESTYPYTREGLRRSFAGTEPDELQQVLGGNAAARLRLRPRRARAPRRRGRADRRRARRAPRPRSPPTPPAPASSARDRAPGSGGALDRLLVVRVDPAAGRTGTRSRSTPVTPPRSRAMFVDDVQVAPGVDGPGGPRGLVRRDARRRRGRSILNVGNARDRLRRRRPRPRHRLLPGRDRRRRRVDRPDRSCTTTATSATDGRWLFRGRRHLLFYGGDMLTRPTPCRRRRSPSTGPARGARPGRWRSEPRSAARPRDVVTSRTRPHPGEAHVHRRLRPPAPRRRPARDDRVARLARRGGRRQGPGPRPLSPRPPHGARPGAGRRRAVDGDDAVHQHHPARPGAVVPG